MEAFMPFNESLELPRRARSVCHDQDFEGRVILPKGARSSHNGSLIIESTSQLPPRP